MTKPVRQEPLALLLVVIVIIAAAIAMLVTNIITDRQQDSYRHQQLRSVNSKLQCPRCGADMQIGVLVDHAHGQSLPSEWTKEITPFAIQHSNRIDAYRCVKCGYIELHAIDIPAKQN